MSRSHREWKGAEEATQFVLRVAKGVVTLDSSKTFFYDSKKPPGLRVLAALDFLKRCGHGVMVR